LAFFISEALVLRITWKLHQSRPTGFSLGKKQRHQRLSFRIGVVTVSLGNTHASASVTGDIERHSSIARTNDPSDSAASLCERWVFSVSSFSRYRRWLISAPLPVSDPHRNAKISPGRIPAMTAN
jgi:hypothetical protein